MPRLVDVSRLALAVYLCLVGVVVFQPEPEMAVGSVSRAAEVLADLGLPEASLTDDRVEFLMNTLLFAPITFLGAFAVRRVRWSEWVVGAFVLSMTIEVVQGLLFPARMATFVDVVANTSGALLGALAALGVARWVKLASPGGGSVAQ